MKNIILVIEPIDDQATDFRKTFDLVKQIEETKEPNRAKISEVSHREFLKEILQGYHAAYFSILQLSLKAIQHVSSELQSAAISLKQVFTFNRHSTLYH